MYPVAPFTGAWIEIKIRMQIRLWTLKIALFTGAWIEMDKLIKFI